MSSIGGSGRRVRLDSLRVASSERPGWRSGAECLPDVGDQVHCTEGAAEVVRILGRTGDGSRLLELILADGTRQPFFAAASNVLVPPREG